MYIDETLTVLSNLLTDKQANTDAFWVIFRIPCECAKQREELLFLVRSYSLALVNDMDVQHLLFIVVCSPDANVFPWRELQGILRQVHQNLLQTNLIAK